VSVLVPLTLRHSPFSRKQARTQTHARTHALARAHTITRTHARTHARTRSQTDTRLLEITYVSGRKDSWHSATHALARTRTHTGTHTGTHACVPRTRTHAEARAQNRVRRTTACAESREQNRAPIPNDLPSSPSLTLKSHDLPSFGLKCQDTCCDDMCMVSSQLPGVRCNARHMSHIPPVAVHRCGTCAQTSQAFGVIEIARPPSEW
jgi:hypothetical protein